MPDVRRWLESLRSSLCTAIHDVYHRPMHRRRARASSASSETRSIRRCNLAIASRSPPLLAPHSPVLADASFSFKLLIPIESRGSLSSRKVSKTRGTRAVAEFLLATVFPFSFVLEEKVGRKVEQKTPRFNDPQLERIMEGLHGR